MVSLIAGVNTIYNLIENLDDEPDRRACGDCSTAYVQRN